MNDYERILKRILSRHDLNQPGGIDQAYEACVDYARQHLLKDPNCNAFLQLAARKLEAVPIHLDRISITTPLPLDARLDMYVSDENEIVLSGNEEGLGYFTEILNRLRSEESNDHLHMEPGEGPFSRRSWPMVVYKEDSEWFDEQENAGENMPPPPDRAVLDPQDVAAVQFLDPPPPTLRLSPHRLHKAHHLGPAPPAGEVPPPPHGWEKAFNFGSPNRATLFAVLNDDGREMKALLNLDDPDVLFFKRIDLQGLL